MKNGLPNTREQKPHTCLDTPEPCLRKYPEIRLRMVDDSKTYLADVESISNYTLDTATKIAQKYPEVSVAVFSGGESPDYVTGGLPCSVCGSRNPYAFPCTLTLN